MSTNQIDNEVRERETAIREMKTDARWAQATEAEIAYYAEHPEERAKLEADYDADYDADEDDDFDTVSS